MWCGKLRMRHSRWREEVRKIALAVSNRAAVVPVLYSLHHHSGKRLTRQDSRQSNEEARSLNFVLAKT